MQEVTSVLHRASEKALSPAPLSLLCFLFSGWWHCVLNLQPSVAVTQNFVSTANFNRCVKDMALGSDHYHANVHSYFSHSCMQAWGWPLGDEAEAYHEHGAGSGSGAEAAHNHDTDSVNEAGTLHLHGDGSCSDESGGRARKRLKQPQLQQLQQLQQQPQLQQLESPLKQVGEISPGQVDSKPATTISATATASPGLVWPAATATTAAIAPSGYPLHRKAEEACVPVLRVCVTLNPNKPAASFSDTAAVLLRESSPAMTQALASPAVATLLDGAPNTAAAPASPAVAALLDGAPLQLDKHLGPWLREIWQAMPEMRPAVQVCV